MLRHDNVFYWLRFHSISSTVRWPFITSHPQALMLPIRSDCELAMPMCGVGNILSHAPASLRIAGTDADGSFEISCLEWGWELSGRYPGSRS